VKLERLHVENFQSLGKVDFNFPSGLVLIDGWNEDTRSHNGVGKSALLNAITYAIYGKLPKSVTVKELIRTGSKSMSTKIDIKMNGKNVTILRERAAKSGKVRLIVNSDEVKGLSKDIEPNIVNLIGLSFEQFVQVVYVFQNGNNRFLSLNDTEKKKFLSTLLDLNVYDNSYKIAHSRLTAIDLDIAKVCGRLESLEFGVTEANKALLQAKGDMTLFNNSKETQIAETNNQVNTAKAALADLVAQQAQAKNSTKLGQLQAKKGEIHALISKNDNNTLLVNSLKDKRKLMMRELERNLTKIIKPAAADRCSECGQTIPGWSHDDFVDGLKKKNIDIREEIAKKELEINEIKVVPKGRLQAALQEVMDEMANERAQGPDRFNPMVASVRAELASYAAKLDSIRNQSETMLRNVERAERAVEVSREKLKGAGESLEGLNNTRLYLLDLKKIFSPTGIRAYVFDGIIGDLNDKISKYLDVLSGGVIQFLFDFDIEKGKLVEVCEYMGNKRSIMSLSGGEYRRMSLAVDLALSDVVCGRVSIYPNVLFLDEAFEGLDISGREMVMELLSSMAPDKDAIYVVDHATEFKTAFTKTFELVKKNGQTSQTNNIQAELSDYSDFAKVG